MIENGIKLTLYQNCIINEKYRNVFCQKKDDTGAYSIYSPFERYLQIIPYYIVELNEVYQEDNTEFNFYLKSNEYETIYNYNYMKIESYLNGELIITRYAFINSIRIVNEMAILKYKIDVWHSFSPSIIGMNKSYLKGKRITDVQSMLIPRLKFLPVDYEGNNELQYEKLTNINRFMLILQVQVYNTAQFGEATKSDTRYFCISWYNYLGSDTTIWINRNLNNIYDIEFFIQVLTNVTGEESFCFADDRATELTVPTYPAKAKTYWKIGNIFVVPYYSNLDSKFHWYDKNFTKFESSETGEKWYVNLYECESNPTPILLENFELQNNYKINGIGLFGLHFPIKPNGTSINFSVYASLSRTQFSLYLNYQNKIIELTDKFIANAPSTQLNGEIIAQQKIERTMQNINDITKVFDLSTGIGKGLSSGKLENSLLNYGKGLTNISLNRAERNLPIYNTTNIVKVNNIAMLNAKEWIIKFLIDSDNDDFVKESINEMGYTVYEYIDYIPIVKPMIPYVANITYDFIQYEIADVYGKFPNDVAKELNRILEQGFKIWYDEGRNEDNHIQ